MSKKIINYIQKGAIKHKKDFRLLYGIDGAIVLDDFFLFADSCRIFKSKNNFELTKIKNANSDNIINVFCKFSNIASDKIIHETITYNIDELKTYIKNKQLRRNTHNNNARIKIKDVKNATLYINIFYLLDMLEFYKTNTITLLQDGKYFYASILINGELLALTMPIYINNKGC